jgi:uncharacterized protein (TIGR00730 family)
LVVFVLVAAMSGIPAGQKLISVFGGRHPSPGEEEYQQAVRLGSLLAGRGYAVLSGGYSGVMEAVSRGATEAGGAAFGVTMEIFGSLAPNPYLTSEIRSRDFFERLEILTSKADGFIALRGGMGTLTEIGLVWNMLQTKTMLHKPLILLGAFWRPTLLALSSRLVISPQDLALLHFADSADEALELLRQLI